MTTMDMILKELEEVPEDRLPDVYSVIHALKQNSRKENKSAAEILSYAGAFSDMNSSDYDEFVRETKKARANLFNRDFDI